MDEQYYDADKYEIEIDIKDLFRYIFSHIKIGFIYVIVGVLLGVGIYGYKQYSENNSLKNYEPTSEEVSNMDTAYQYRTRYENQVEANQKDALLQLNTDKMYQGNMRYYVYAGENTNYLMAEYNAILLDNEIWEKIQEASGLDTETQYLKNLVACNAYINGDSSDEKSGLIVDFAVYMPEESSCQSVMDVIDEAIKNIDRQSAQTYSDYIFSLLANNISVTDAGTLYGVQNTANDTLNSYVTQYTTIEGTFSEQEAQYYKVNYLGEEQEAISPFKYIVLGIVVGFIVWFFVYVMKYAVDKSVKTVEDGKLVYGLNLIGSCSLKENSSIAMDYLIYSIAQLPEKKILLSADPTQQEVNTLLLSLKEACANVCAMGVLSKDVNLVEEIQEFDGVILVITIKKTKHAEVQRELDVCALHNLSVIGYIAVDE